MSHSPERNELGHLDSRIWMLESNVRRRTRTRDWNGYHQGHHQNPDRSLELREQQRLRLEGMAAQLLELKAARQKLVATHTST